MFVTQALPRAFHKRNVFVPLRPALFKTLVNRVTHKRHAGAQAYNQQFSAVAPQEPSRGIDEAREPREHARGAFAIVVERFEHARRPRVGVLILAGCFLRAFGTWGRLWLRLLRFVHGKRDPHWLAGADAHATIPFIRHGGTQFTNQRYQPTNALLAIW
jgi:hypothetical protein